MATANIPVDILNPGQVLACLGLMEALEILRGPCEGAFDYTRSEVQTRFILDCADSEDPITDVVQFLFSASVEAVAPEGSSFALSKWDLALRTTADSVFPFPLPNTPATLPAVLLAHGKAIPIDYWGDDAAKSGRDNLKFWAGSGGYPGVGLARDALVLLTELSADDRERARRDPCSISAPQKSSFRFDWRRDYIPMDVGFSPNEHTGKMVMVGYPLVELLAAIGAQHARFERPERRNKLSYRYAVSNARLPTPFVRAVLGAQDLGFPSRKFHLRLGWPGQEGQARCIIDAQEEYES